MIFNLNMLWIDEKRRLSRIDNDFIRIIQITFKNLLINKKPNLPSFCATTNVSRTLKEGKVNAYNNCNPVFLTFLSNSINII